MVHLQSSRPIASTHSIHAQIRFQKQKACEVLHPTLFSVNVRDPKSMTGCLWPAHNSICLLPLHDSLQLQYHQHGGLQRKREMPGLVQPTFRSLACARTLWPPNKAPVPTSERLTHSLELASWTLGKDTGDAETLEIRVSCRSR